jgi:digeranylgeranylglycerophospholipid reductase
MRKNFDVIVIGAGPGGSIAAKICAEKGLNVALVEKNSRPGEKICAGGLELQLIREFNIKEEVIECFPNSIFLCNRKQMTEKKIQCANVYRSKFDAFLAENAIEAGAKFFPLTKCLNVIKERQKIVGVTVKSDKNIRNYQCDVVIAADGFNSITAKSAGLFPHYTLSDFGVTLQCEVYTKSDINSDAIHLFYGNDIATCGYGWIYPKTNSYTVGLGCLSSEMKGGGLVGKLLYLIYKHPVASKILHDAISISKYEGACVPLKQSDRIFSNNILVIGDAAGHVAPLSGSGVYYAMKGGQLAAEIATEAVSESNVSERTTIFQNFQILWNSLGGDELSRQKKILQLLDGNFAKYMELQIFLDNNPIIKKVVNNSLLPFKYLFFNKIFSY